MSQKRKLGIDKLAFVEYHSHKDTITGANQMNQLTLKQEKKEEAAWVLARIAQYSPDEQKTALAFLRGVQFGQALQTPIHGAKTAGEAVI